MRNLLLKSKWLPFLFALMFMSFGVLTIVFSNRFSDVICILWALCCFFIGCIAVLTDILSNPKNPLLSSIIISGAVIGFGVFLLTPQGQANISIILKICIPLILIGIGTCLLIKFTILVITKTLLTFTWASLGIGVLSLTIGIIFISINGEFDQFISVSVGILLILCSIGQLVSGILNLVNKKN